ncbi:hypothetical protein AYI69_g8389 [Smittium culicis]|uniref:Secreted beta-glucosidase adg3 n=1 Tax=Smittium culicis TaxID=133412 RepID=A0A1R1XJU3_9FUNG|nr:hypothetical protein AYI69_g8389 [Smittium culicis]
MNSFIFNILVVVALISCIIPSASAAVITVVVYQTVFVNPNEVAAPVEQAVQLNELPEDIPTQTSDLPPQDFFAPSITSVVDQPIQAAQDNTIEQVTTYSEAISTQAEFTLTSALDEDNFKGLLQSLTDIVSQTSEAQEAAIETSEAQEAAIETSEAQEAAIETSESIQPSSAPSPPASNNNFNYVEGTCKFPWNFGNSDNIVPITTSEVNGGWAMSPNQMCTKGSWCPYACAPGYYSAQWDPNTTQPNGPGSMNGGLYCDNNGVLQTPFPDRAYCIKGMSNVKITNKLSSSVSACQTIYPGNEAMLIPTVAQAGSSAAINVNPKEYWLGTSSQYYVNLAGSNEQQCIWGDSDKPVGNWAPYVFGAGQGPDGNTYISVVYNELYIGSGFSPQDTYNVRINCVSGFCNFPPGNECKCENGKCSGSNGCTVTLSGDATAEFELY